MSESNVARDPHRDQSGSGRWSVDAAYSYVTANIWGRDRDGSLWLDVPAQMVRLGLPTGDRQTRQAFARRALRELRENGSHRSTHRRPGRS